MPEGRERGPPARRPHRVSRSPDQPRRSDHPRAPRARGSQHPHPPRRPKHDIPSPDVHQADRPVWGLDQRRADQALVVVTAVRRLPQLPQQPRHPPIPRRRRQRQQHGPPLHLRSHRPIPRLLRPHRPHPTHPPNLILQRVDDRRTIRGILHQPHKHPIPERRHPTARVRRRPPPHRRHRLRKRPLPPLLRHQHPPRPDPRPPLPHHIVRRARPLETRVPRVDELPARNSASPSSTAPDCAASTGSWVQYRNAPTLKMAPPGGAGSCW